MLVFDVILVYFFSLYTKLHNACFISHVLNIAEIRGFIRNKKYKLIKHIKLPNLPL